MQLALLRVGPMWAIYLLQPSFAFVPIFVLAMWRSPLAVWMRVGLMRIGSVERRMAYTVLLLVIVVVTGNLSDPIRRQVAALEIVSQRRLVSRDLAEAVVRVVPPGDRLAVVAYEDLPWTHAEVHAMPAAERSAVMLQFDAQLYGQLLAAMGRGDIVVVPLPALTMYGGWLVTNGKAERAAAERTLRQQLPEQGETDRHGDQAGGLWEIVPASE
jgi:hypothetical protein